MQSKCSWTCPDHGHDWCPDYSVRRWEDGTVVIPIDPAVGGGGVALKFCPWCGVNIATEECP